MRRPDSDGTNRVHAGDRHVRRGSSEGSGGTQTRVRVHGSEDGRTTVTLECPDQVLDVPVQLRPEVDLVESASDADVTTLEEHETPTKEKLQPGHRDHAAFRKVRRIVMVSDLLCALLVLAVVPFMTHGWVWVLPATWLLVALICSARSDRIEDLLDRRPYLKRNAHLTFGVVIFTAVYAVSLERIREVLVASAVLAFCGVAVRTIIRWMLARGRIGKVTETVLVVGRAESVRRTIAEWRDQATVDVVGACISSADTAIDEIDGVPVLGHVSDVEGVARQLGVDIIALHDVEQLGGLRLARLQYALEEVGAQLSVITPVTNMRVDRASVRRLGRRVVMDISYGTPRRLDRVIKTAVDQVVSLLLLVIALPILALCALAVRLTSSGPAFFKQVRVGEAGTTFVMYKLRTMRVDAEDQLPELLDQDEVGGGLFKITDDPRITRVGKFLRRSSLDELPQLLNVLKGQMSLVGPRPALPREVQTYDDAARRRLAVKPGMTGLWQVSGRSNLSWDESVLIDRDYVDNWRPCRDLAIAMRTVSAVITRRGAH
jgi:exopolysaccharide biosynthesis polyprenyl glycosylphosphotransferase